nr:immunoglobulin light chain junction region [Macaca mulatta]MOW70818.1 immunoglobulin light chain junction region [Macaca mulatta]
EYYCLLYYSGAVLF